MICIADSPKVEATLAVSALQRMGIKVAMLTGDNTRTAWAIAEKVCRCTTMYMPLANAVKQNTLVRQGVSYLHQCLHIAWLSPKNCRNGHAIIRIMKTSRSAV